MAKDPYPSETADRYIVRFPDGMREQLKVKAEENSRSLNAEIVQRLALTLSYREGDKEGVLDRLDAHEDEIVRQDSEIRELTYRLEQSAQLNKDLRSSADAYYARMNALLVAAAEYIDELPDALVLHLFEQFTSVEKERGRLDADFKADLDAERAARVIRGLRDIYVHKAVPSVRDRFRSLQLSDTGSAMEGASGSIPSDSRVDQKSSTGNKTLDRYKQRKKAEKAASKKDSAA